MYKLFFDRLYQNAYRRGRRSGSEVFITVHFIVKGKDKEVAKNQGLEVINALRTTAEYYQPDKIMVVVKSDGKKKVYEESFDIKSQDPVKNIHGNDNEIQSFGQNVHENDRNFQTNSQPIQEFSNNAPRINGQSQPVMNGFTGFGQVGVEEYINKKLEEDRTARKLQELQSELETSAKEIETLRETIQQLEDENDQHIKEKEELNGVLESKKNIRYWAGLTGDILESLGLEKSKLKEPLAGLIASEEGNSKQLQDGHQQDDQSGIVEDSSDPTQQKREELISLINAFLSSVDNQTLANLFFIFSEIEQYPALAEQLVKQLNQQKE